MARLVAAFGSSHSIMLTATGEDWISHFRESDRTMPLFDKTGAATSYEKLLAEAPADSESLVTREKMIVAHERTLASIAELKRQMGDVQMDALIVIGDDQHELFQDSMMPALALYYGASIRNEARSEIPPDAGWYRRAQMARREPSGDVRYPVHSGLARHLVAGLTEHGFEVCAVRELAPGESEGHAFSYIHRTYLSERRLPVVPVMLNTYYPPNAMTPARCVQLGEHLHDLVALYPDDLRVGILASGGLSHFVVDEELDLDVIAALRTRDLGFLAGIDPKRLQAGSSEIRSWMVTGAAAPELELSWVAYVPAYRTPALTGTGLCFAHWS
jgi:Catalytic LigB subunit of aromatic ring-opening dioxygenase